MNKQGYKPARAENGRWLPGQTGNAAGRGMTNRQRISERLLADLAEVWQAHGKDVLTKLAITDPGKLAQIAYGLLPRDVFISVEPRVPGNLDPDEWATLRRVLDIIQASGVSGSPDEILAGIEQDLRARFATEIEPVGSKAVAIALPRPENSESDQSDSETK